MKCLRKSLLKGKLKPKKVVFIVERLGNSRVLLAINLRLSSKISNFFLLDFWLKSCS